MASTSAPSTKVVGEQKLPDRIKRYAATYLQNLARQVLRIDADAPDFRKQLAIARDTAQIVLGASFDRRDSAGAKEARAKALRARQLKIQQIHDAVAPEIVEARKDGISWGDIQRALNEGDIKPFRGGEWSVQTIRRIYLKATKG